MQPIIVIYVLWVIWLLSWLASSLLDARPKRLSLIQAALYRLVTLIASVTLLFGFMLDMGLDVRKNLWLTLSGTLGWTLTGLMFVAVCISWWARIVLGFALPDAAPKQPAFAVTGPYRVVRHPIYLSLIVAAFATAAVFGRPSSLAGAVLLSIAFIVKILIEESALRREIGAYDDYVHSVPMLVPFLPKRGAAGALATASAMASPAPIAKPLLRAEPQITIPELPLDIPQPAPSVVTPAPLVKPARPMLPPTAKAVQLSLVLDDDGETGDAVEAHDPEAPQP